MGLHLQDSGLYWAKTNRTADLSSLNEKDFFCGLGYWTRANVEQCLLATRGGSACPRMSGASSSARDGSAAASRTRSTLALSD